MKFKLLKTICCKNQGVLWQTSIQAMLKQTTDIPHLSSREISTPTVCIGACTFVLMTGAKFLRINLKVLHPTVMYLQKIKNMIHEEAMKTESSHHWFVEF
jgi:hypothetical protein